MSHTFSPRVAVYTPYTPPGVGNEWQRVQAPQPTSNGWVRPIELPDAAFGVHERRFTNSCIVPPVKVQEFKYVVQMRHQDSLEALLNMPTCFSFLKEPTLFNKCFLTCKHFTTQFYLAVDQRRSRCSANYFFCMCANCPTHKDASFVLHVFIFTFLPRVPAPCFFFL